MHPFSLSVSLFWSTQRMNSKSNCCAQCQAAKFGVSKRPEFSYLNSYLCTIAGPFVSAFRSPFTAAILFCGFISADKFIRCGRRQYHRVLWLLFISGFMTFAPSGALSLVELWSLCAGQRRQLPSINQVGRSNCISWLLGEQGRTYADAQIWMLNKTAPAYRIINFCAFVSLTSKKGTKISNYLWRGLLFSLRCSFFWFFLQKSRRKPGAAEERGLVDRQESVSLLACLKFYTLGIGGLRDFLPLKSCQQKSLLSFHFHKNTRNKNDQRGTQWGNRSQIKLNKTEC